MSLAALLVPEPTRDSRGRFLPRRNRMGRALVNRRWKERNRAAYNAYRRAWWARRAK